MGQITYWDPNQGQRTVAVTSLMNGDIASTGETQDDATILKEGNSWLTGKAYTLPDDFAENIRVWNISGYVVTIFPARDGGMIDGDANEITLADREVVSFFPRAKKSAWMQRSG